MHAPTRAAALPFPATPRVHYHAAWPCHDFQDRHLAVASLPVLLQNQDKALGDLLRQIDFRRALALGIDRDQINAGFFLNTSKPGPSDQLAAMFLASGNEEHALIYPADLKAAR